MKIALDVMGGDNAPHSNILGAKQFIENNHNSTIILVGDESLIKSQLKKYNLISKNIEIHHCSESISMSEDKPAMAFKTKPDSSIVQSIKLVKENKADAVISAGNTAALLSTSLFILGKIDQIKRPTLATHFPTRNGGFVLTDVGANTDVKPDHLLQFAIMGSIYAKHIKKTDLINIGLLNIGAEKNKGNILTQKAHQLFEKNIKGFIGNIEPRYVFEKDVDVVVCDGFSGNIIIKLTEGLSVHLYDWINSNPLGSAAGYGVSIPLDREFVSSKLNFNRLQNNSLYVQNSRGKYELQIIASLKQIMLDIRKIAWDFSLFLSKEFNLIAIDKKYCTGSSIMPNKLNPDVIEILRANYSILAGLSSELENILSLPSGYHRDLQLTKRSLIGAFAIVKKSSKVIPEIETSDSPISK